MADEECKINLSTKCFPEGNMAADLFQKFDSSIETRSNSLTLQQSPRRRKESTGNSQKLSLETKETSTKPAHLEDSQAKTIALATIVHPNENALGLASQEIGFGPPAVAAALGGGLFGGRRQWLKLKTVQMLDSNTLLGDKDRALPLREILVDGLGNETFDSKALF